jgi:hypothetical protein
MGSPFTSSFMLFILVIYLTNLKIISTNHQNWFNWRDKMKWYDEIAKIARELYEKSGRKEGCDLDNWLEAERIVMARYREQEMHEAESSSSSKKKDESKG